MSELVSQHTGCVLIVDDEEDIRETLRELVEMEGCSVLLAGNGEDGLRVLETHKPCLVVLDLRMPVMGGMEMLGRMQREPSLATLPVLVSTSSPELVPTGIPVLAKPIDIETLWGWMRRTCACAKAVGQGVDQGIA